MRGARIPVALAALALLAGCAAGARTTPPGEAGAGPEGETVLSLFAAGDALERPWRKVAIWKDTSFDLVADDRELAIRAVAEGSSAALVRRVEIDPQACPVAEWSWRIDAGLEEADLSSRRAEDVAASVFFAFGDPGLLTAPAEVPTLRYVWATETDPPESVIDSPYFPGTIRSLVVRSGPEGFGSWTTERRNLLDDYARVFGGAPEADVQVFALFTDSDHGESRVEALYRWARVLCTEAPEPPSIF